MLEGLLDRSELVLDNGEHGSKGALIEEMVMNSETFLFRSVLSLMIGILSLGRGVSEDSVGESKPRGSMFTGLEGRSDDRRAKLVKEFGGNDASETAVAGALKWIASHQLDDGGWSFDHRESAACGGKCKNHGAISTARNAATAMALLPFLGAGQTHLDGKYKTTVAGGLKYLLDHQAENGSFHERFGMMYSHGLCSIALCEAHGMTGDKALHKPAQKSIDFIVAAQDPVGGGWRYSPRQPGDTSVTGWQMLALQTGRRVGLEVPNATLDGAARFLKSTGTEDGAHYGYTGPGMGASTTAIGLLCRQFTGDTPGKEALKTGVEFISKRGPSITDTRANWYYNFHATALIRCQDAAEWKKWNVPLRDKLIATQSIDGHMSGSWFLRGGHGAERAGRLYCTSLAALLLESYYRHTRRFVFEM